MEDRDLDKLSENVMALLREMSQRQTMMFHLLREIYEESRLPIKLVREVEEDVYLSRRNPRDRGVSGRDEDDREGGDPMAQLEGMGNPDAIPMVPEGMQVTCIRCSYQWRPRIPQPSLCAKCNAPWWYAPRWRWHMKDKKKGKSNVTGIE